LRFHGDHGSPLRDILLRVSVLGVFAYALFSLISGTILGLNLNIPSLLVAGTAVLVLLQVSPSQNSSLSMSTLCRETLEAL
jgi:hypothetical protein